jgi:cell division protein ZapD
MPAFARSTPTLILYEYPFNESIRTMLRLEHLFDRLGRLMPRDETVDHHYALATLFEIMDVASRADLKSDLLKELERQRTSNEWLMSIRSRISIPGGTCEFDLPAYYAWQQHEPARRRTDLNHWVSTLMPLAEALKVLLGLLRDTGAPHKVVTQGGQFQQSLPAGRVFHLLRLRIDPAAQLIPEISGHRLMVMVRLMRQDAEGRLKPAGVDTSFELTLCS